MREPIPHDYLALWGVVAIVAGLLFPIDLIAGLTAVGIWVVGTLVLIGRYR